jgi:2-desacetyl-2-hydroxyethyl bacteriochlorophyllide A dehydrogenase
MSTAGRRLVFYPGGRVTLEETTFPDPGPHQLLVQVTRSQISAGSEMNGYRSLLAQPPDPHAPGRGTGYTTVGRVLAVGPDMDNGGFREGDRILAYGNHASHVLLDTSDREAWRSYPAQLPYGVTDEQACYAVLGDVALHGVRRAGLQIDESVAVFGVGVVGQLTVQFARLSGAHPIVVTDLYARRLALARAGGATHTVDASEGDPVPAILEETQGGAQTVFHCSPVAQLLQTAMRAAAPRGKVVLTGSAPGIAEIGLQVELLRHELTILGNYESGLTTPHAYWPWTRQRNRAATCRLIASGQLQVDALTSHVVAPQRAEETYRMLAHGGDGWMSVFFDWETV